MGTIEREPEVIDSLTSTSTIDALSANQGKVLKELIHPTKTSSTLLNRSEPVSSDENWHSNSGTVDISEFTSLVLKVTPHGSITNCGEIDMQTLKAIGSFSVSSYWTNHDLGVLSVDKNGNWSITCKTYGLAFDYVLFGVK